MIKVRIITLILMLAVIVSPLAYAADTIKFHDLEESHWAYDSIEKMVSSGIIVGYPDGTFKPEGNITRAELVKVVNMVYSYTQKREMTNLNDVMPSDWFYEYVLVAQSEGYIVGYPDGTFKPNGYITREEFCKIIDILNNLVELPYDGKIADVVSEWAVVYVSRVVSNRLMLLDENNNFRATENATRAEVCNVLAKFIVEDKLPSDISTGSSSNTNDITKEELHNTMDNVIRRMKNGVMPNLSTESQKTIANDIISNMEKYKVDNSHDYRTAAELTFEKYKQMSEQEQEDLKYQIQLQNTTQDLLDLKEFFFPDVEI